MKRILAVAEYVFKQSFRNRILNVLIVFAVFAIGFSVVISSLAQESELKMINDFGLFSIAIFSFLTLALSITVQMFEETELKTLLVVMVKPVKRYEYIIGKYTGIMAVILMNVILMLITLMVIIRIKGGDPWDLRLILAASGTFISIAIIASIALLLSVVTTSVPSCIISLFFIYVLGHLMIHLKNLADKAGNAAVKLAVDALYYIVPNLELFNLKDKIYSSGALFSLGYIGTAAGYAALYVLLAITITSYIFEKKEFY
jgi:ABC-type transport system involved in multi-copper enzyme maturation permease subunit